MHAHASRSRRYGHDGASRVEGFGSSKNRLAFFGRRATMTRQAELQKINAVRVNDLRCPLLPRTSRAPTRAAPSSHSARFARRLLRASDIARAAMPLAVVGDYELTRKIGEGGYGRIFLGRKVNGLDEPEVVLKQVKLPSKKTEREMCLREVSIMKGVHHPCILECVESFIHRDNVYIVMPHCSGGDLASLLARQKRRGRRLPESIVLDWFAQILLGVEHLHSHDTLHRDLKSQNVFLRRDEREPASPSRRRPGHHPPPKHRVALGDFGVARSLQLDKVAARTFVGTPIFMSPEMFNKVPYGHKADMWALGCVLYEMMALREPFAAKSMEGLARVVRHANPPALPTEYGASLRETVRKLLSKDPAARPSARQLIEDVPEIRDACARALAEAGATAESAAAAGLGNLGRMSAVNAFDAAKMAGQKRGDMNLPAAATADEHAARSQRTAAKQARRCGVDAYFPHGGGGAGFGAKVLGTSPDDDPGALRPAFARPAAMQAPPRNRLARAPAIAPIREADEEPAPCGMIPPRKASPRDDPEAADDAPARPISPLALPAPDERHIRRGAGAPPGAVGGGSKPHFAAPRPSRARPAPRGAPPLPSAAGARAPLRALGKWGEVPDARPFRGLVGGPFDERAAAANAAAANAAARRIREGIRAAEALRAARGLVPGRGGWARGVRDVDAAARERENRPPDFALKRDAGPRAEAAPARGRLPRLNRAKDERLGGDAVIARLKAAANRAEAAELDRLRAEVAALPGTRVGLFDAASPPSAREVLDAEAIAATNASNLRDAHRARIADDRAAYRARAARYYADRKVIKADPREDPRFHARRRLAPPPVDPRAFGPAPGPGARRAAREPSSGFQSAIDAYAPRLGGGGDDGHMRGRGIGVARHPGFVRAAPLAGVRRGR